MEGAPAYSPPSTRELAATGLLRSWSGSLLEPSPADEAAAQRDEGIVEVEASLTPHGQALELVQQGKGLHDYVAELAQTLDVRHAPAGDHRQDPAAPKSTAHSA